MLPSGFEPELLDVFNLVFSHSSLENPESLTGLDDRSKWACADLNRGPFSEFKISLKTLWLS